MIRRLFAFALGFHHAVEDILHVTDPVGYGHFDRFALDLNGTFFDAIKAADVVKLDVGKLAAGDRIISGTKGCFHDTAGDTEDGAGAGVLTQNAVSVFTHQCIEIDARLFDHAGQLTRGDDNIHILAAGGIHLLGACDFMFLSRTGHDGDDEDFLRIVSSLLGVEGLGQGPDDLVRRFAR